MRILTALKSLIVVGVALGAVLIANCSTTSPTYNCVLAALYNAYKPWLSDQWVSQRAWKWGEGLQWNMLYHLGGNGPWIQKIDNVVQDGFEPPAGCQVEQVHMVSWSGSYRYNFLSLISVNRCQDTPSDTLHQAQEAVGYVLNVSPL